MHVANFGVYASAERNLVFAINDFDEVHPGPWEWDLKRLAASAAVAARFMGGDKAQAEEAARGVRAELSQAHAALRRDGLSRGLVRPHRRAARCSRPLSPQVRRNAERTIAKARAKGHIRSLDKLTEQVDGEPRIVEDVPLIVRETHTEDGMPIQRRRWTRCWRPTSTRCRSTAARLLARYRIVDAARKVVGVGSVGTGCWVILLQGVDNDDPLFLQVKEAKRLGAGALCRRADGITNDGQRVVVGQRATQGSPDIFLGWGEVDGKHFYVRQLADMKGSASFSKATARRSDGFIEYCGLCGWALALAHAKSRRPGDDRGLLRHARPRSTRRSPSSRWPTPSRPSRTMPRSTRRAAPAASRRPREGSSERADCRRFASNSSTG